MPPTVASQDAVVYDPDMQINRKVFAGQPVPPDLVGPYQKATGEKVEPAAGTVIGEPAAQRISGDYDSHTAAELQTEADTRGLQVQGSGQGGNVVKADLVEALEEDDAS